MSSASSNHQCGLCSKTLTRNSGLDEHLLSHQKLQTLTCRKGCQKKFIRPTDRNKHERAAHGEKKLSCSGCGKKFGRRDALKSHLNSKANSACAPSALDNQGALTESSTSHESHKSHEASEQAAPRRYYSFTFDTIVDFDRCLEIYDVFNFNGLRESGIQCNICFRGHLSETALALDLMQHIVDQGTDQFQCPECFWLFSFNSTLASHLHNTTRRCQQSIPVYRKDGVKFLVWGCGKFLRVGESHHEHWQGCDECDQSKDKCEQTICVLAFQQLTDLWADHPSIVSQLDEILGCNSTHKSMVEEHMLLRVLHEKMKEDSWAEPILPRQPKKAKEMRNESGFLYGISDLLDSDSDSDSD